MDANEESRLDLDGGGGGTGGFAANGGGAAENLFSVSIFAKRVSRSTFLPATKVRTLDRSFPVSSVSSV